MDITAYELGIERTMKMVSGWSDIPNMTDDDAHHYLSAVSAVMKTISDIAASNARKKIWRHTSEEQARKIRNIVDSIGRESFKHTETFGDPCTRKGCMEKSTKWGFVDYEFLQLCERHFQEYAS